MEGEGVAGTVPGGGSCAEFCCDDLTDKMEQDIVTLRGSDDPWRFLTEAVVAREWTT